MRDKFILYLFLTIMWLPISAQINDLSLPRLEMNYENPKEYIIGGIAIYGNEFTDKSIVMLLSGLHVGQKIKIPGDELKSAIEKLWAQKLFKNVEIKLAGVEDQKIYLNVHVEERPRMSKYSIRGLRKNETNNLRDVLKLKKNQMITEDLVNKTKRDIFAYFHEKGFFSVKVDISKVPDSSARNAQILKIAIDKGKKVKVNEIIFAGVSEKESPYKKLDIINNRKLITENSLKRGLKPKQKKGKILFFLSSKYVPEKYEETKPSILGKYLEQGYRDARFVSDSITFVENNRINILIKVEEGKKYYFRNITWVGNTKYRSGQLDTILGIKKGDLYNLNKLEMQLRMNPNGFDVSSIYMDDGYLFFNVNPVEVNVENDSIDLEIRVVEGKQATVNNVTITGNDKTSDHVIMRLVRTKPGDKFSRSDIQRTMRELAQLGYFDPEGLDVVPNPNPSTGTVDIEYKVVEKPSDQIEASGGWGGWGGVIGTIGLTLNNFSSKRMFEKGGWEPLPAGDGQMVSLRVQSSPFFSMGSFTFVEPWMGGKKPNSLSVSIFHNVQYQGFQQLTRDRQSMATTGASVDLGRRLRFPDDYFTLRNGITFQRYRLSDWSGWGSEQLLGYTNGNSYNLFLTTSLDRNSTDHPIYPASGSKFNLNWQISPPYSWINNNLLGKDIDYANMSANEKYRWVEMNKVKFSGQWFLGFPGNAKRKFVLAPAIHYGGINFFNSDIGFAPFEQFLVGGAGLQGFRMFGTDIIAQRGYGEGAVSNTDPRRQGQQVTQPIFTKYTLELRYPISLSQSATVFVQTFVEAGNAYANFKEFNPFNVRRAAGAGVRLFLPMFGLLGVDYAWGFDNPLLPPNSKPQGEFHFFMGQQF